MYQSHQLFVYNIRIHHECEGGIENSVHRINVWHHEAYAKYRNGVLIAKSADF